MSVNACVIQRYPRTFVASCISIPSGVSCLRRGVTAALLTSTWSGPVHRFANPSMEVRRATSTSSYRSRASPTSSPMARIA